MSKIVALITACGRGIRFGGGEGIPKQYLSLAGMSVLRRSIIAFLNHPQIANVICVINPNDVALYEEATIGLDLLNPVFGAESRQISVKNGLLALRDYNPSKVLIHDAVRPFVSKAIISGVIDRISHQMGVIPAIAVQDTLKKVSDGKIEATLERENLWHAQTPQGFYYEDILNAHLLGKDQNFTDDAAIGEYAGLDMVIVPGSQNNFKITTKDDYERAKNLLPELINGASYEMRVGNGFDVHAFCEFELNQPKKIRLGGIEIDSEKKILAHSDGDVVIHALIDAILGAIGAGDIGEHFPPTDNKWRNCDSRIMLTEILRLTRKKDAKILNIDLCLICEKPKILKFKTAIKLELAKILSIEPARINVKATTTEKLGFLGREEGIACQASALLNLSFNH